MKIEERIEQVEAAVQAAVMAAGTLAELHSMIGDLQKRIAGHTGNDQDQLRQIKVLSNRLDVAERNLASHGHGAALRQTAEAIVEGVSGELNAMRATTNQDMNEIRAGFKALAAQLDGSVKQLEALADNQTELAATRLLNAARFFSSSPTGNGQAKGLGIVEQTILNGVTP